MDMLEWAERTARLLGYKQVLLGRREVYPNWYQNNLKATIPDPTHVVISPKGYYVAGITLKSPRMISLLEEEFGLKYHV